MGVVRTIISFGIFGAATLHITVCGPGNGSQRCMGANAKAQQKLTRTKRSMGPMEGNRASVVGGDELVIGLLPKNRADVYVVTAESKQSSVILFSRRLCPHAGIFIHLWWRSFATSQGRLPSSSCLSLQDDRSGLSTRYI